MKNRYLLSFLLILLAACQPAVSEPAIETAVPSPALLTETAVPQPTAEPEPTQEPVVEPNPDGLPTLIPPISQHGTFPVGTTWSLAVELPESETAVAMLSQPPYPAPLTAEQATAYALTFGFTGPLYVESRSGFSHEEMADMGRYIVFDDARSLSLWGAPFVYEDASHPIDLPPMAYEEALPLAEQFLRDNGWLTFPYETMESDQGEGVLFLPIRDGVLLTNPAFGVRVAADGGVSRMAIYPQDSLAVFNNYPMISAESAWQQVQADPNQEGIFFLIDPPPMETPISFPPTYYRLPGPGESGTVYNNIYVFRPLTGDGPPIVQSTNYYRINGSPEILDALAAETDYLIALTGMVEEVAPGQQTMTLTDWQLIPEAGGLPMFFGQIVREGGQIYLHDSANQMTYLLPDAPAELREEIETAVAGLPETVEGVSQINWQQISSYPPQEETIMPTPTGPLQSVTIKSVKLVYLRMSAYVFGLENDLFFPAWQFTGPADNGERVTIWVTAVLPETNTP